MSDESDDSELRDRLPGSRAQVWLVLDADRRVVAAAFLAILFGTLIVAELLIPTPTSTLLTRGDPHETLFQALVGSVITGVTLVLTLSQIVLSQELGAVGDQRERMEGALTFRDDAADVTGKSVPPAEPASFLQDLVASTCEQAETFADAAPSGDVGDAIDEYVDDLTENADDVTDQLEGAEFGSFEVVRAALNFNYSLKIYQAERIRAAYGDELNEEASDALDELLTTLELFGPAREHFKTLYFQWELSDLSRTLLYAAMPALSIAVVALLLFDPAEYPGTTLGVNHAFLGTSAAATVAVLPFALLLAYILRIVTVTKRTLSIGPFILRQTDRSEDIDYSE
ncbi:hypothetical protein [Halobacterium wangiae]|uniref:hypothetical protein n=1 Tax=Halobacterium wangiae TaxID=2902623 RepID=UPI001E367014|nr:hypothetical protein [Halobacterium wangiae]